MSSKLFYSLFLTILFISVAERLNADFPKVQSPIAYEFERKYEDYTRYTLYLPMRDSVLIAVDAYLPDDLEEGEMIPAILHQTRYWRAFDFRFPMSLFLKNPIGPLKDFVEACVQNGYAFVNVDARGSGASFGSRAHPWTAQEIEDGYDIVEWIIRQPWSNGKVASGGASYSGTTSEFLMTTMHPAIKAIVNMYALFDVYEDNAFPGGVHHYWFTKNWGEANEALDNNRLPFGGFSTRLSIRGVSPVNTRGGRRMLRQAIREHQNNGNVHDGALEITFRDDVAKNSGGVGVNEFSPHFCVYRFNEAQIPVYNYTGWMDGAYHNANIKRYLNLDYPGNKLIIGPWEHGGVYNISPANPKSAEFDHIGELMKFLDYHVKGIETGIENEPAVFYYTMVEEKWKASDVWPPANANFINFYLHENNSLILSGVPREAKPDTLKYDTTFGTGVETRWRSLMGRIKSPEMYHYWNDTAVHLLSYQSQAFTSPVEITGHPVINLNLSALDSDDGTIFVYLEDIDPDGNATYITEGQRRLIHSKLLDEPWPVKKAVPVYNSYLRADASPMEAGEIREVTFDLLPTSYLIREGHSIRISITGGDKDHFAAINEPGDRFLIYTNRKHPSRIELPLIFHEMND